MEELLKSKQMVCEILSSASTNEEMIDWLLKSIGARASVTGYEYLKKAILILLNDPNPYEIKMTKEVYPGLAKEYYGSCEHAARVERNIRYAIKDTIGNANVSYNQLLIRKFIFFNYIQGMKITNSDFMFGIVNIIKNYANVKE